MSSPHRVRFVKQLDGSRYGGLNCNCAAAAMALDRHTVGQKRTTGARVRQLTGDTSGGTNLLQVNAALGRGWGVYLTVRQGASIASFDNELHDGHGAILQGASSATRGTKYQASPTFAGNHSWYVNEGRGWRRISGVWVPTDYLVYDPLADGRRTGIARSPFWLPRRYLLEFARRLRVGSGILGYGKVYAAFTRDTEPHYHPRYGGARTKPFPDRTRARLAGVNVRSTPSLSASVVDKLGKGELFIAYQRTDTGQLVSGSRRWYGDHNGKRWVHSSGLGYTEGTT
jgi:hypothetical protein